MICSLVVLPCSTTFGLNLLRLFQRQICLNDMQTSISFNFFIMNDEICSSSKWSCHESYFFSASCFLNSSFSFIWLVLLGQAKCFLYEWTISRITKELIELYSIFKKHYNWSIVL